MRELRAAIDDLGENSVPLYVTEVGWPTAGSGDMSAPPLPDATRAGNLSLLTDALLGSRRAPRRTATTRRSTTTADR